MRFYVCTSFGGPYDENDINYSQMWTASHVVACARCMHTVSFVKKNTYLEGLFNQIGSQTMYDWDFYQILLVCP